MDKRIQELIEQTKCLSDGYNTGTVDLQKFAELIVRECIDVLVDVLPDIVPEAKDGIHPIWHIKEHFGVK